MRESIARNLTAGKKDPNEYLVEVEESREQVAILDPRDFKLPAAPSDFKFELPYVGVGLAPLLRDGVFGPKKKNDF